MISSPRRAHSSSRSKLRSGATLPSAQTVEQGERPMTQDVQGTSFSTEANGGGWGKRPRLEKRGALQLGFSPGREPLLAMPGSERGGL